MSNDHWPERDPFNADGVGRRSALKVRPRPTLVDHEHTCPDGTRVVVTAQHIAVTGTTLYRWFIDGEFVDTSVSREPAYIAPKWTDIDAAHPGSHTPDSEETSVTTTEAMPWPDGPFLGFDIESTGTDVETARIVTATAVIVTPGEPDQPTNWLADPGVDIPAEATAVHGITTAHARECGAPAAHVVDAIAERLKAWWAFGLPVVAFNATYDLTVLDREMRRHHGRGFSISGPVLDPFVIDKALSYRKGKRKLVDVCAHYGIDLTNAHSSDADALAAVQLMPKLAQLHSRAHGRLIGQLSLRELWTAQVRWAHDQAQSFEQYKRSLMLKDGATAEEIAAVVIEREWPLRTLADVEQTVAGA